jgi:hypothetical protein
MDATLTKLHVWPAWQKLKRLVVSAAHEDFATGARVEDFCETLARSLGCKCQITKELWPLMELRTPKLRAIAASEASRADLVIVSVHHGEALPAEIQSWVDLWGKQRNSRAGVLLALFDAVYQGSSSSIQACLQETARKGKMEFLVRTEEKPED